jgi:Flp pilus assembly protein TadG
MYQRRGPASAGHETGAAAVEFALVLPVLLLVVFGIIQYGYYFYASQDASAAAREAARRSAVGDCDTQTKLEDFVKARLGAVSYSDLDVTRTYTPTTPAVGGEVSVTISFTTLNIHAPFVPVPSDSSTGDAVIISQADARVEDLDEESCS